MNKPDFKREALSYTRRQFVDYGDNTVEEQIATAYEAGCEHVWNTHVLPLQEELKSTVDEKWEVISDADKTIKQLQAENKILREEIERLKADHA